MSAPPPVPPQAITAAHRAFCLALEKAPTEPGHSSEDWVRAALEAAAPHLDGYWRETLREHLASFVEAVAAERERCAQLAESEAARFHDAARQDSEPGDDLRSIQGSALEGFAALLREAQP